MRSKGLLNGLASGTNWVFRDESMHMNFALEVVNTVRNEQPELVDAKRQDDVIAMIREAVAEAKRAEEARAKADAENGASEVVESEASAGAKTEETTGGESAQTLAEE